MRARGSRCLMFFLRHADFWLRAQNIHLLLVSANSTVLSLGQLQSSHHAIVSLFCPWATKFACLRVVLAQTWTPYFCTVAHFVFDCYHPQRARVGSSLCRKAKLVEQKRPTTNAKVTSQTAANTTTTGKKLVDEVVEKMIRKPDVEIDEHINYQVVGEIEVHVAASCRETPFQGTIKSNVIAEAFYSSIPGPHCLRNPMFFEGLFLCQIVPNLRYDASPLCHSQSSLDAFADTSHALARSGILFLSSLHFLQ